MQIAPPQILSYRYTNERSVAFKIRQNPFSAVALPRTPLGELMTLPRPLSRLERGHPSPYPVPLGTDPPSALAMRPPRSAARSTPMPAMFKYTQTAVVQCDSTIHRETFITSCKETVRLAHSRNTSHFVPYMNGMLVNLSKFQDFLRP